MRRTQERRGVFPPEARAQVTALACSLPLSVADGKVLARCASRKRFVDFQAFLHEVVAPEAQRRKVHTLALILDNGSTHAPKQLRQWLRAMARREQWSFDVQLFWLPTNASWLDQIEIWFSILQRKLLQPNHFVSLQALQAAIADFIAHYNLTAKPIRWSYTVAKLDHKLKAKLGSPL
jgi:transposase